MEHSRQYANKINVIAISEGVFMYMYFRREIFNSPIRNVNPPE